MSACVQKAKKALTAHRLLLPAETIRSLPSFPAEAEKLMMMMMMTKMIPECLLRFSSPENPSTSWKALKRLSDLDRTHRKPAFNTRLWARLLLPDAGRQARTCNYSRGHDLWSDTDGGGGGAFRWQPCGLLHQPQRVLYQTSIKRLFPRRRKAFPLIPSAAAVGAAQTAVELDATDVPQLHGSSCAPSAAVT